MKEGYNVFDMKDKFFNDICSTYTAKNGQVMTLSRRKNKVYDSLKDFLLCQSGLI